MRKPPYFEKVRTRAAKRWEQLESDPELAGPWHQLFKQVQSPRHVLSELLQNADDAQAKTASARIEEGELVFEHDGEDFTEEHFDSLCKFGYSNKRNLHTIGFRGIGFKSTFSLGDPVRLQTPTLSVEFHRSHFTEPVWRDIKDPPRTTQVRVRIKDSHRRKELEKNLEEWLASPLSLLFFRSISSLTIQERTVERKRIGHGPAGKSEWVGLSSEEESPLLLVRSKPKPFPAEAVAEIREERMAGDDLEFPPCEVEIVLGGDERSRLFVVLPTGVEVDLPFACNAPFLQDPARSKIKPPETSPTNRWLLKRLGILAAQTMLAWVHDETQSVQDRCEAYGLFPNADTDDASLEGVCARLCQAGFRKAIKEEAFLLADRGRGRLVRPGRGFTVPKPVYTIWDAAVISRLLGGQKTEVLSRYITDEHADVLEGWQLITRVRKPDFLDRLAAEHFPRPRNWSQLLELWAFVAPDILDRHFSWKDRKDVGIVPVADEATLHAGTQVLRIQGKGTLVRKDDWRFLSKHFLLLDQTWPEFLEKKRRAAEERHNEEAANKVEAALGVLSALSLDRDSPSSAVIARVTQRFFSCGEINDVDCVRLAHMAAILNAEVPEDFEYVTRCGERQKTSNCVLLDKHGRVEELCDADWCEAHFLHPGYLKDSKTCPVKTWLAWAETGRSRLVTFPPIERRTESLHSERKTIQVLEQRGVAPELQLQYRSWDFEMQDWDFDEVHTRQWGTFAGEDARTWGDMLNLILEQPEDLWKERVTAKLMQVSQQGRRSQATWAEIPALWVMRFRDVKCLRDTRGQYHEPASLLRRTGKTEALLDVEDFVDAELDTEGNRTLLRLLGVSDTPTGFDKLMGRIRAFSGVSDIPMNELGKWYGRLDAVAARCSSEELSEMQTAFEREPLIFTEMGTWACTDEVFIEANIEDVPDAPVVHSAFRELELWPRLGVRDRPTFELCLRWLSTMKSGTKLDPDHHRRVRSLLARHAMDVWSRCRHWVNLNSEWVCVDSLKYCVTLQSLGQWDHLFDSTKRDTADFCMIPPDFAVQRPFVSLRDLAASLKEEVEIEDSESDSGRLLPWLSALGEGLSRVKLEDADDERLVREEGKRLKSTRWQPAARVILTPYLEGEPVGVQTEATAVWNDQTLYVKGLSMPRLLNPVVESLGKHFRLVKVIEAIKACYDRDRDFVRGYLESTFNLVSEDEMEEGEDIDEGDGDEEDKGDEEEDGTSEDDAGKEDNEQDTYVNGGGVRPEGNNIGGGRGPKKPPLVERFAKKRQMRREEGGFRSKDGKVLRKNDDGPYHWTEYSKGGEPVCSYWVKEHCLTRNALELPVEVWKLLDFAPDTHALVLVDEGEEPRLWSGSELRKLKRGNKLVISPTTYRVVHRG